MSNDQFIFKGEENAGSPAAPRTDSELTPDQRKQTERNLARFLSDPENRAKRPAPSAAETAAPKTAPTQEPPRQAPPVVQPEQPEQPAPKDTQRPAPMADARVAMPPAAPLILAPPPVSPPITPPTVPPVPPAPATQDTPNPPPQKAARPRRRWVSVLVQSIVFCVLCTMVWVPTLYYIKNAAEVFETSWRIILPGEGVKSSIDIDTVGEAKTSEKSIFASRNYDPRSTYREIASSSIVTAHAKEIAALEGKDFEGPKIKVIPQTAILQFSLRRHSPETAQEHARIFMQSFDARVTDLRSTELLTRKNAALANVNALREQLEEKQRAKLDLQREAGLVSEADYRSIVENAGKRRNELTDAEVDLRNLVEKFRALSATLGVPPHVASQALILKSDRLYQSLAAAYVTASTELASIDGNFGRSFPNRVMTAARRDEFAEQLKKRIRELTGETEVNLSLMVDLTQSAERSDLFATLVRMKANLAGQIAKVRELRTVVTTADAQTFDLAGDADRVAAATQEAQIANAIFASALANADLSQTNPYASYPLYQILDEPKLPRKPVAPKKVEAIAGAAGATLLIITGFAALWYRRRILRRRQKKALSSGP